MSNHDEILKRIHAKLAFTSQHLERTTDGDASEYRIGYAAGARAMLETFEEALDDMDLRMEEHYAAALDRRLNTRAPEHLNT